MGLLGADRGPPISIASLGKVSSARSGPPGLHKRASAPWQTPQKFLIPGGGGGSEVLFARGCRRLVDSMLWRLSLRGGRTSLASQFATLNLNPLQGELS